MAAANSYRAEMTGLSERDRNMLRSLLAATQARTGLHWDGDATQPRVHFIDIDTPEGADFWQSLGDAERRQSTILVSQTAPAAQDTAWLPKPLRSSALLNTLEQISMPIRKSTVLAPSLASASAVQSSQRLEASTSESHLLEILEGAGTGTALVLQSPHWPDLVLGIGNKFAMRTAALESYMDGFAVSLNVAHTEKYTGGPLDDGQRIEIDALRWLALLHAPIAEIAQRLPDFKHVRLSTLPAFARLPHSLQHVRMAAWLTKHPASPEELADMVGVDEETALRFLGACAALGLLQEVSAPTGLEPVPVTFATQSDSLLDAPLAGATLEVAAELDATTPVAGDTRSLLERVRAARAPR